MEVELDADALLNTGRVESQVNAKAADCGETLILQREYNAVG